MATIRTFGDSWWGKAWLDALEHRALADPNRLPRGRTYARQGRVTDLEVEPGALRAMVDGRQRDPYSTVLSLRTLSDREWSEVLDVIMGKAANIASLLAGEVPAEIGDLVLPNQGDLGPECSCPDWAEPCKHAAALCYVAADLLDADPFVLLTLRGRSRESVLREVRERRTSHLGGKVSLPSDLPRGPDPGVRAAAAFRREPRPVDRSPLLVNRPGAMVRLAVSPSADSGIDPAELAALAADAAARAWAMIAVGDPSRLDLSVGADVVRRALTGDIDAIARTTGLDPNELAAAVTAWRVGGLAGYRVHTSRVDVKPERLNPARELLGDAARVRNNTVTADDVQLRLDEDGLWWRFGFDNRLGWVLTTGPGDNPADVAPPV